MNEPNVRATKQSSQANDGKYHNNQLIFLWNMLNLSTLLRV